MMTYLIFHAACVGRDDSARRPAARLFSAERRVGVVAPSKGGHMV